MHTHFKDGSVWLIRFQERMCPLPPLGAHVEPSMFSKQRVESEVILNQRESLCGCYSWKGSCCLESRLRSSGARLLGTVRDGFSHVNTEILKENIHRRKRFARLCCKLSSQWALLYSFVSASRLRLSAEVASARCPGPVQPVLHCCATIQPLFS